MAATDDSFPIVLTLRVPLVGKREVEGIARIARPDRMVISHKYGTTFNTLDRRGTPVSGYTVFWKAYLVAVAAVLLVIGVLALLNAAGVIGG